MTIVQKIPLSTENKIVGKYEEENADPTITQTVREEWRVVSNAEYANGVNIFYEWLDAGGCDIGDWYPGDTSAVCKSITFKRSGADKQKGGPFAWNVTVEFTRPEDTERQANEAKISVGCETNDDTDGRYDFNGELNVNSAGDFFADKLPLKNKILVFRYQLNYLDNPTQNLIDLYLTTNSESWHGLEAGTCLLRSIGCTRERHAKKGFYYWNTTIEIAYNPKGWKYKKADCGYYTNSGRILNDEGAPVETAQLLDGRGDLNETGEPVWREFDLYGSAPFGPMGLPCPFEDNSTPCPLSDNTQTNASTNSQGE